MLLLIVVSNVVLMLCSSGGFSLTPKDPCNPLLMACFNGVVFLQISSHASADSLAQVRTLVQRAVKVMSLKALARWAAAAMLSGVLCLLSIRLLVPKSSEDDLGALLQVAQLFAVTVYLFAVTNRWTSVEGRPSQPQSPRTAVNTQTWETKLLLSCLLLLLCLFQFSASLFILRNPFSRLACLISGMLCLYPGLRFAGVFAHDIALLWHKSLRSMASMDRADVTARAVSWSHTLHGRVLLSVTFALFLRYVTDVPLPLLLSTGSLAALISLIVFVIIISKDGPFRALQQGDPVAIVICTSAVGIAVGYLLPHGGGGGGYSTLL